MRETAAANQRTKALQSDVQVGLLMESEALASGLEMLLSKCPRVGRVTHASLDSLPEMIASGTVDLFVVSVDQWHVLGDFPGIDESHGPKVLVVGDGLHHRDVDIFSSRPVNGFAETSELSTERINDILGRCLSGQLPIPSQLARKLLSGPPRTMVNGSQRSVTLTPREKETLALLVRGLSNKQVARELGISTHGAKRLVTAILLKLGAPNRTAAVVTALKLDLA